MTDKKISDIVNATDKYLSATKGGEKMKLNLKKLKLAMACKCLSSKGLAEKAGINYVTLIPYLNGKREPGTEALGKIAKALDVDPETLID